MKEWYLRQSQRDQQIVIAVAALVLAVLIYAMLIQPLITGLENRRASVASRTDLLSWMSESAAKLQRVRGSGATNSGKRNDKAAYVLLDESIRNAGLSAAADRIEPAGKDKKGARVQFSQVDFDKLVRLLGTLQSQYGLGISHANISQKDGGMVSARITLDGGG